MVNKMPGYRVDKFANLRVGYAYMFGHCGKKLLFMGQDFAQEREWSEERELDWYLLEDELHSGMKDYFAELLKLYKKYPSLYEFDNSYDGFQWINADDTEKSIYSFFRKNSTGKNNILFILNFTPVERSDYRVGVPDLKKKYKLLLNSDEKRFGGKGIEIEESLKAEPIPWDGQSYSIGFTLPAYGAVIFKF